MLSLGKYEVTADKLCWQCDPSEFQFESTNGLAPLREFIGQERAIRAVEFGLSMSNPGYNIYVAGIAGTGKTSVVKSYIEKVIRERGEKGQTYSVNDWCYLYNFADPDRPKILNLPKGKGKVLKNRASELLKRIREGLGRAFSSEEYNKARKRLVEEGQNEQQKVLEELSEEARQRGFLFQMTPSGPILIPLTEGKPLDQAQYLTLDEATRRELESRRAELAKRLQDTFDKVREEEKVTAEKVQKMDKDVGQFTVSSLFKDLFQEYEGVSGIRQYLEDLKSYTLEHVDQFKGEEEPIHPVFGVPASKAVYGRDPFLPFEVNVFVDNSATQGPPVVIESNPNYSNMFGKIERRFFLGGYLSDHTMLKPGALSLANGGYLLLSTRDVLMSPAVWPTLKRAIKDREVRIEDPFEQLGLFAPQGLRPQPMPIDVKIILIGDSLMYQLLSTFDEDFWEIFKVKADFDYEVERTPENVQAYAAFISGCCEEIKIRSFDRTGVAKVIEYASRIVADQEKLSSRFAQIKELVEEAAHWAARYDAPFVTAEHVKKALDEKIFRHNLIDERLRDLINRGTLMIDIEGSVVGQINGLAVYSLGDIVFGKPSRITAKTFLGRGGVINIERESQLSGRIHDKGVLILSGYLGWKYAQDKPLSLSASLCFEQSYEGVEGDSASSAELYAVISSIAEVPIKQNIAVTGSVNQKGEIQPIGSVNEKIEGFFQVCKAKGLTGAQGVMIPYRNLRNLMLRGEVVEAVKQGKFHVYAIQTIDDGIEVLTGIEAGVRREDGTYPEDTVNFLVDKKLRGMAERLKGFQAAEEKKGEKQ